MQARNSLAILSAIALLLSACSSGGVTGKMETSIPETMLGTPTRAMMQNPSEMMGTATPGAMMNTPVGGLKQSPSQMMGTVTPEAMKAVQSNRMEPAAWFSATLTNVSDSSSFTINDFKGKVVLVETMAQWCPTCLSQEKQVQDLRAQLGMRNDYLVVGLDIDPNEDAAALKSYVVAHGFDWLFAISPAEISGRSATCMAHNS